MRLRRVELGDVDVYVRMRCDPAMMAELGGPQPREGIEAKVARDVSAAVADQEWICMIQPDDEDLSVVAGSVVVFPHPQDPRLTEMGWMVLPQFQGRGVAKAAVRMLLERAAHDGRWGEVHAFPGVSNPPSNGICRSLGFTLVGEQDVTFAGRTLRANHWRIDPASALPPRKG